jgi:hypothetical protein
MEKYISYCLYGNNPKYFVGAEKNILINKKLLPDWKSIIYYDSNEIPIDFVDKIEKLGGIMEDVSKLSITKSVNYQMFWRYFIFEKNCLSIVRDLDSRISNREVEYINKWINSFSNYFIIRDHPWQSKVPGGLFGIKNSKNFWEFFQDFVLKNKLGWGVDQTMLGQYIDNIEEQNISYFGFDKKSTYIDRDDKNFFIGIQLDETDNPVSPNSVLALQYLKDLNL